MNTISLTREAQHARLLHELRARYGVTTSDAREDLAVMHPAGRVRELRAMGYDIQTHMVRVSDASGARHRQAMYVLRHPDEVAA